MPPTQNYIFPPFSTNFPLTQFLTNHEASIHTFTEKTRRPPQIATVLKRPYKQPTTLCRNAAYGQKTAHQLSNLSPHLWFYSTT